MESDDTHGSSGGSNVPGKAGRPRVELALIIFAAADALLLVMRGWTSLWEAPALLVLAGILLVGVRGWRASTHVGSESRPSGAVRFYVDAWHLLWRQRWVVWLFGLVAVASIAGALVDMGLRSHYLPTPTLTPGSHNPWVIEDWVTLDGLLFHTTLSVTDSLRQAPGQLFPSLGHISLHTPTYVLLSLAVLVASIWAFRRLKAQRNDPYSTSSTRLMLQLLIPMTLLFLIASLLTGSVMYRHATATIFPGWTIATSVVRSLIQFGFFLPLLMGGVLGSLKTIAEGRTAGADSFLDSAVRHFKPLAGAFLLLWTSAIVLESPSLLTDPQSATGRAISSYFPLTMLLITAVSLLLSFVPYAVVRGGLGLREGLRRGIGIWRIKMWECLSFTALGTTLIALAYLVRDVASYLALPSMQDKATVGEAVAILLRYPIDGLVAAVVLVAVWNFSRILFRAEELEPHIIGAGQGSGPDAGTAPAV